MSYVSFMELYKLFTSFMELYKLFMSFMELYKPYQNQSVKMVTSCAVDGERVEMRTRRDGRPTGRWKYVDVSNPKSLKLKNWGSLADSETKKMVVVVVPGLSK